MARIRQPAQGTVAAAARKRECDKDDNVAARGETVSNDSHKAWPL